MLRCQHHMLHMELCTHSPWPSDWQPWRRAAVACGPGWCTRSLPVPRGAAAPSATAPPVNMATTHALQTSGMTSKGDPPQQCKHGPKPAQAHSAALQKLIKTGTSSSSLLRSDGRQVRGRSSAVMVRSKTARPGRSSDSKCIPNPARR